MAVTFDDKKYETNKTDGVETLNYTDKEAYNFDPEVSKKDAVKVFKHSAEFITSATEEVAKLATDKFNTDKELNQVLVTYPFGPTGSGTINVAAEAEVVIPVSDTAVVTAAVKLFIKPGELAAGAPVVGLVAIGLLPTLIEAVAEPLPPPADIPPATL